MVDALRRFRAVPAAVQGDHGAALGGPLALLLIGGVRAVPHAEARGAREPMTGRSLTPNSASAKRLLESRRTDKDRIVTAFVAHRRRDGGHRPGLAALAAAARTAISPASSGTWRMSRSTATSLRDLDADLRRGTMLGGAVRGSASGELERRLLEEGRAETQGAGRARTSRSRTTAVVVAVAVPLPPCCSTRSSASGGVLADRDTR